MQTYTLTIPEELAGARLDKALAVLKPDISRSRIKPLIESGQVIGPGGQAVTSPKHKVTLDEIYQMNIPELEESTLQPQVIDIDIIYEDQDIIIVNKPVGLTVHPGAGQPDNTLANALLAHAGDSLSGIGGVMRPGIVHRLDKDTSGLLVVAKHDAAHQHLSAQLEDRSVKRTYLAAVWGVPSPTSGMVEKPIGRAPNHRVKMAVVEGGKDARTHYTTRKIFKNGDALMASLLECQLDTGRTHQIRVHMQDIGVPLIGDALYGRKGTLSKRLPEDFVEVVGGFKRQALHAWKLALIHPTSEELMEFEAPIPEDMEKLLDALKAL